MIPGHSLPAAIPLATEEGLGTTVRAVGIAPELQMRELIGNSTAEGGTLEAAGFVIELPKRGLD
jgi:hypothetical protein